MYVAKNQRRSTFAKFTEIVIDPKERKRFIVLHPLKIRAKIRYARRVSVWNSESVWCRGDEYVVSKRDSRLLLHEYMNHLSCTLHLNAPRLTASQNDSYNTRHYKALISLRNFKLRFFLMKHSKSQPDYSSKRCAFHNFWVAGSLPVLSIFYYFFISVDSFKCFCLFCCRFELSIGLLCPKCTGYSCLFC